MAGSSWVSARAGTSPSTGRSATRSTTASGGSRRRSGSSSRCSAASGSPPGAGTTSTTPSSSRRRPARGRRLPILVAAKGERVLRLTARWADAWNAAWFGLPDERFAQRRADLVTACEAEGRDPAIVEITTGITIDNEAAAGGRPGAPDFLPADPDVIARALDAWRDLGVGHVQVDLRPADERTIEVLLEARAAHRGEAGT